MNKDFKNSERGSESAWRGFSSQTIYIAYRLMHIDDEVKFFPETVEDLMIKNKVDDIIELVQVKNLLSKELSLSDLSPKENDSFFRRCLAYKEENDDLKIKIVSFGAIGIELDNLIKGDLKSIENIEKKLLEYNYDSDDIKWIIKNLEIEQVDEVKLREGIYDVLSKKNETMASPKVSFEVLINYVSNLSRYSNYTNKIMWNEIIEKLGLELANISGMAKQFGRTIIPMHEHKDNYEESKLKLEYSIGVNALPQHIRANLDIRREYWLNKIHENFKDNDIVVVRGASGQGKSTIAYRYLIDNYPECHIFCIQNINDKENAIDIFNALNGISSGRKDEIIAYIDVNSYDVNWLWICEIFKLHASKFKLLITIREEDFNRSQIDYSKHTFTEVQLLFSKEEAEEIYKKYNSSNFLTFSDSWKSFGEKGPLMEYTYMLSQNNTLKYKLEAQINSIIENENNADNWLNILIVISYISKNNIRIDLNKIFSLIECNQMQKMLKTFEKEYFLKVSDDNKSIETLHALRSKILYDILINKLLVDEKDIFKLAVNCINDSPFMFIVEYIYRNGISNELIEVLINVNSFSWKIYSGMMKALLWGEVHNYYNLNKTFISEGDKITNNTFVMLFINDITGLLGDCDISSFLDILAQNSDKKQKLDKLLSKIEYKKINYKFLDLFIEKTYDKLKFNKVIEIEDLSSIGFILYWLSLRNKYILEENLKFSEKIGMNNLNSFLDFIVGIKFQKFENSYELLKEQMLPYVLKKYNIIYFEEVDNNIIAYIISDIFGSDSCYQVIMEAIEAMRRLFPDKENYNVKMIGQEIIDNIEIPDKEKNIPKQRLPFFWITQLNNWILNINEYENALLTWEELTNYINNIRKLTNKFNNKLINGIEYLYKKYNISRLTSEEINSNIRELQNELSQNLPKKPKCDLDRYGINLKNEIVDINGVSLEYKEIYDNSLGRNLHSKSKNGDKFDKSFSTYKQHLHTFINSTNNLIGERYSRKDISNNSRLSVINLNSVLGELKEFQESYQYKFFKYESDINIEEELNQFILLSSIWEYLYNNPIHPINSLSYDRKENIKKINKELEDFFENEIKKIDGVCNVEKNNNILKVVIDISCVTEFYQKLFTNFKSKFGNIEVHTLKSVLLNNYLSNIQVNFKFGERIIRNTTEIKVNNLIIYKDIEKFIAVIIPMENKDIDFIPKNINDSAIKIFGNIGTIRIILKHFKIVEDEYIGMNVEYINDIIYDNWISSLKLKIEELISEILEEVIYIHENAESCESLTDELYMKYIDILKVFKEEFTNSISIENYEQINNIINSFENEIGVFIELFKFE